MNKYRVIYSPAAYNDLDGIVSYIIETYKDVKAARSLSELIRSKIRSLTDMPERYPTVEWEPWSSENMHKIPIRKLIVFYSVNIIEKTVTVARILYSGRNTEDLIKNDR